MPEIKTNMVLEVVMHAYHRARKRNERITSLVMHPVVYDQFRAQAEPYEFSQSPARVTWRNVPITIDTENKYPFFVIYRRGVFAGYEYV